MWVWNVGVATYIFTIQVANRDLRNTCWVFLFHYNCIPNLSKRQSYAFQGRHVRGTIPVSRVVVGAAVSAASNVHDIIQPPYKMYWACVAHALTNL